MIPGARRAFQVIHPGSPMLRIRYRNGVPVGPHGFPDWVPYARALVAPPPSSPDLNVDEARVVDVLAANIAMTASGDPLWTDLPAGGTPAGWTWAHLAEPLGSARRIALVPVELHGAFRHLGGVSTGNADRSRRGLPVDTSPPTPARVEVIARLAEETVTKIEQRLGYALPSAYRGFLARTNGGRPRAPAVHTGFGFVVDQPFFGVARQDWLQDVVYANAWFGDRLTRDWLAVGYVQGGLIAVRVDGGDEGSVWYLDDDDPRGVDDDTADDVCQRLLHRCADDFAGFWLALSSPPETLRELALNSRATILTAEGMGASLPASRRANLEAR